MPAPHLIQITPAVARTWLAATLIGVIACVAVQLRTSPPPDGGQASDIHVLQRIVARVHYGENYYDAAGPELRAAHFGTRSVFNWRQPTYAWLLGACPSLRVAQVVLVLLALAAGILVLQGLQAESGFAAAALGLPLMVGALIGCFLPDAVVVTEVWAGALIALSIGAYGRGWQWVGFGAALLALFLRELVGPYALICAVLSWRHKRRAELLAWVLGLIAYFTFFAWHARQVMQHIGPADRAYPSGWVQFGGLRFVLSTASMNVWLALLPRVAVAIYFPLALLGLLGYRTPTGKRAALTVLVYATLFAIVGKPFNQYWGMLTAPALAIGGAVFAPIFRTLLVCAARRPAATK